MSLDTSERIQDFHIGQSGSRHAFYRAHTATANRAGKQRMHDLMLKAILDHASPTDFKLLCLPGEHWQFEMRLNEAFERKFDRPALFAGFEKDYGVMLRGCSRVPRCTKTFYQVHGFRCIESLGVTYFRTNRARWVNMDVNHALTLNNSYFDCALRSNGRPSMLWWLNKFCGFGAAWLDYYGPVSGAIIEALSSLRFHCRGDVIPVGITVLKGREVTTVGCERKALLEAALRKNSTFQTLEYFEYSDLPGSTMCNLIGLMETA